MKSKRGAEMKYIRTEDGIYEVTEDLTTNKFGHLARKNDPIITIPNVGEIIKQADTIEELCDEFVYEYQTGVRVINKKIIAMPDIVKTYGAIWTDWGLKYVAKMNEKGDFELL